MRCVPVVFRSPFVSSYVRSFVHVCISIFYLHVVTFHISRAFPHSVRCTFSAWRCMSVCYQLSGYIVHYDDSCQLTSKIPKLSDAHSLIDAHPSGKVLFEALAALFPPIASHINSPVSKRCSFPVLVFATIFFILNFCFAFFHCFFFHSIQLCAL